MSERTFFVYITTNKINTVLYVGITNNLGSRIWQHKESVDNKHFTKRYNVNKLVYYESFPDPVSAITREKQIKGWVRKKKEKLINGLNPGWIDLYELL